MTRSELLHAAEVCVCGQREEDYGTPEDSFRVIGELWETYLKAKCIGNPQAEVCIVPEDVAALLGLLKIARIATGHGKSDNWVDLAGYAACGGELQSRPAVSGMKRLTVDTELSFCDIAQCDSIPGGSFCEDGRCDQRRCYEKLREYERSDLEPETLQKAQGLLKELKDARQTVELMDACGKRVCSSEEHWGCPYGNEGMTDCAVLLEAAYEDTIEKLLALKETLEG